MGTINKCFPVSGLSTEDRRRLRELTAENVKLGEDAQDAAVMAAESLKEGSDATLNDIVSQIEEQGGSITPVEPELKQKTQEPISLRDEGDVELTRTGQPVVFNYIHNTESATGLFGKPSKDAAFGRGFEPSGRYVTISTEKNAKETAKRLPNIISGKLVLVNPLVVPNNSLQWKEDLSQKYNGKTGKALSKALIKDGYDGVITTEEKYITEIVEFTTFDETKALYQKLGIKKRGAITKKAPFQITLTEDADLSTFLHETGHLYLLMEGMLAQGGITEDQQTILDWLGAESFETITTEQHEQFADGFLKYLSEGKAPSQGLARAFASFRSWLMELYRRLQIKDVKINDDVRGVFDRMLATDAEIEQMKRNGIHEQFFESAESAGMTQAEFDEYQKASDARKNKTAQTLDQKLLKEMRRKYEKEWKAELNEMTSEEEVKLAERPLYQAEADIRKRKLDRAKVKEILNIKAIPPRLRNLTVEGGVDPSEIAVDHEFDSADELLQKLNKSPRIKELAKLNATYRMQQKHGDILNDGTIEQEAIEASQNEDQAKALLIELRALNRQAGKPNVLDLKAVKIAAEQTIASMPYREIRPYKYYRNEVRAAQAAKAATDPANAALEKTRQISNQYLYKAAREAKEKMDKERLYLRGVATRKYSTRDISPEHISQLKILAASYDFKKGKSGEDRARAELIGIARWISAQTEAKADSDNDLFAPAWIDPVLSEMGAILSSDVSFEEKTSALNSVRIKPYSEMTPSEMRGVYDMAKNIRFVGGKMSESANEEFARKTEAIGESIKAGKKKKFKPMEKTGLTYAKSLLDSFGADQVAFVNMIAEFDQYQEDGPLFTAVYQDIIDSTNNEIIRRKSDTEKLNNIIKEYGWNFLVEGTGRVTIDVESGTQVKPEPGIVTKITGSGIKNGKWTLTRRGRVMLAMYNGSPEGHQAILDGFGVSEADLQAMLNTMPAKELNLVEDLWALNEEHWPDVSETAKKMTGISPPKVEHRPFVVNGREMNGGYTRLFYMADSADSIRTAEDDTKATRSGSGIMRSTKHGARHERVGSGGKSLSLDLNHYFTAMEEVNHDISFSETASDSFRIILSKPIREAIFDTYGEEKYQALVAAMNGVVAGKADSASGWINTPARYLRTNATYALLGLSVRNLVQQPVALTNGFGKVGELEVMSGLISFYMHPFKWVKLVQEKSPFMRDRTNLVNRDIAEISARLKNVGVLGKAKLHAFSLATFGDAAVAYPIWIGAYRKGMKKYAGKITPDQLDKKASDYASEMVSATIGSGLMKDLSPIMMGKVSAQAHGGQAELVKTVTFMGSFFNKAYNLSRDAVKTTDFTSPREQFEFTRQMIWYMAAPGIWSALAVGQLPNDDDDEGWAEWMAQMTAEYGISQLFIIRDLVSLAKGFKPSAPYSDAVDNAWRAAGALQDDEYTDKTFKKILKGAAAVTPLPGAGQLNRTVEYIYTYEEEGDFNLYHALVRGKKRD